MNIPEFKQKESIKHCDKIQRLKVVGKEKLTKVTPSPPLLNVNVVY